MVACLSLYQRNHCTKRKLSQTTLPCLVSCRLFLRQAFKRRSPLTAMSGFHSGFYNNPYNNDHHEYQPPHVTMFGSLKKKLSRRSSNPVTDPNTVQSTKSMGSRSSGLTPPPVSNPLSSASPATRRPSKLCNQPLRMGHASADVVNICQPAPT